MKHEKINHHHGSANHLHSLDLAISGPIFFVYFFVSFLHLLARKNLRFSGVNAVIFFQDPMLQNLASILSSLTCRFLLVSLYQF